MEFGSGHLKEPLFLSGLAFWLIEKCAIIHELQVAKSGHFEYFMAFFINFIQNGCFQPHVAHE